MFFSSIFVKSFFSLSPYASRRGALDIFQYNYTIFCSFSQEFFPKTYSFVLHPAEFVFSRMVPGVLLSVFSFTYLTFVRYIFNNFFVICVSFCPSFLHFVGCIRQISCLIFVSAAARRKKRHGFFCSVSFLLCFFCFCFYSSVSRAVAASANAFPYSASASFA